MNTELNALKDALDGQREHVLGILEGLSEQDLRRPVLPTGWNCLGWRDTSPWTWSAFGLRLHRP